MRAAEVMMERLALQGEEGHLGGAREEWAGSFREKKEKGAESEAGGGEKAREGLGGRPGERGAGRRDRCLA